MTDQATSDALARLLNAVRHDMPGGYRDLQEFPAPQGGASVLFAGFAQKRNSLDGNRVYLIEPGAVRAYRVQGEAYGRKVAWTPDGRYAAIKAQEEYSMLVFWEPARGVSARLRVDFVDSIDFVSATSLRATCSVEEFREGPAASSQLVIHMHELDWRPLKGVDILDRRFAWLPAWLRGL